MVAKRIFRSALLGTVLVASGCGTVATAEVGASESPAPSDELVLRVEAVGGFTPPSWTYSRIPMVSIYADGRVITEGPQVTIYPAPALPNLQVKTLPQSKVDDLVSKAREAGVGTSTDYGQPGLADATTTRFTLVEDGKKVTSEVYALSETREEDPALTAAQREARDRMRTLLGTLRQPRGGDETSYAPSSVATIVSAYTAPGEETPPPARAWRGAALPGPVVGPADLHCVTTTGDALAKVLTDAESANVQTPWTYDGKQWSVSFRPLLPDESGCDSLGK
ncbi:hypothetical protein [Cryptosporangium sp. NPDC048952]|uniref:hypothetical protein n=1 Tax=Cryptosporangium sp. NPDC048952 TaxID=3363961 RepID=UPI003713457D